MPVRYIPLPADIAAAARNGEADVHGQHAEFLTSDGSGIPCRRCLDDVPEGRAFLLYAHRPFAGLHPYAETGPIFLCANDCTPPADETALPPILAVRERMMIRGYDGDERIVEGTGGIVPTRDLTARAEALFANPAVCFIHVRSASNGCYQCRIERA